MYTHSRTRREVGDLNLIPVLPLFPQGRKKRFRNLFTKIQAPAWGRCPVPSPYCFTHTDLFFLKKKRWEWGGGGNNWIDYSYKPMGVTTWKKVGKPQCTSSDISKEGSTHSRGEQLGSGGAWAQTEVGHGLCTPNTRSKVRKFHSKAGSHLAAPWPWGRGGRDP